MLDDTRDEKNTETSEGGPDVKEAEALAAALNHSAERVQTLWFSFLTIRNLTMLIQRTCGARDRAKKL